MAATMAEWRTTPEQAVSALYEGLLGRAPDPDGLNEKAARLASGETDIACLCEEMVRSAEFIEKLPLLLSVSDHGQDRRFTNDVSQYGEIWELVRACVNDAFGERIVVDVGARGRDRSNSFDLCRHFGWKGLLIEANPKLLDKIAAEFAGLDIVLLGCAVSNYDGVSSFTIGANDDVSSLDAGTAANWGETRGTIEVEVRRLAPILREAGVGYNFGLLSLDIEGEDVRVLNDLIGLSDYRPQWVIIEASDNFRVQSLEDAPFSDAVRTAYVLRAQTPSNLMLERNEVA